MGKLKKIGKRIAKYKGIIFFILSLALVGFIMGYLGGGILKEFFEKFISNDKWYLELLNVYIMVFIFILGFIIHIIIHEVGHLIFGLLSGYKFVSFRVASFTLVKEDGKLQSKRFNIPGTAGQCLMMPPEKKDGDFPFILYNLGGALVNTIVSLITIFIALSLKDLSWMKVILLITSAAGLFAAITNGLPLKIGGISNDGHNIRTMLRDQDSKESFYLQLRVNGLLSEGIRIKDMPYDQFILQEDMDYKNPLNFSKILINHVYHLDKQDFTRARAALDFGRKHINDAVAVHQMEVASEELFLELIGDCNRQKIEELYDKNLKKYIGASKFMIGKKRLMMAYELLYKGDKEKALQYFKELQDLANRYPIKGEADMELMLGEYLKGKIQN